MTRGAKRVSAQRWKFAQRRQRGYQERKARRFSGREGELERWARERSRRVAQRLAELGLEDRCSGRVVEVGSGAHGLIWRWPAGRRVAIDPLAEVYRRLFPALQRQGAAIVTARGEELPLATGSADLVLSDNVLDHVEDPARVVAECRRVLRPGGALFLTVDVHHPLYGVAGRLYNRLFEAGLRPDLPAFPSHPFHFRRTQPAAMLAAAGFDVLHAEPDSGPRPALRPRRPYDLLKRLFYKNLRLELVALGVGTGASS